MLFKNILNQRLGKRLRGDKEDLTTEILVSQASTSTITGEVDNTNPNLLTTRPANTHNRDALTIKLNRLWAKLARYNSHKGFLFRCIQEKLAPKGLELTLKPTIGDYDEVFIDNWYFNLKNLPLIIMKQILTYCERTEKRKSNNFYRNWSNPKVTTKERWLAEIQNTIKVGEKTTKEILHKQKFKMFNTMKYKPKTTVKTANFTKANKLLEKSATTERPTHVEILKATKNSSIKTSKWTSSIIKPKKNIQEKLRSLSPTIRTRKQRNMPLEIIHKIKCKAFNCFLEYESVKDNSIKYKCLSFNKNYSNKIDEELKSGLRTNFSFVIMVSINLFCC